MDNGGISDEKVVQSLKLIFDYHKTKEDGFKRATQRNAELEKELHQAQEELMNVKTATLGRRSKKQKEEELRAALEKNFNLQEELRKVQEDLTKYKSVPMRKESVKYRNPPTTSGARGPLASTSSAAKQAFLADTVKSNHPDDEGNENRNWYYNLAEADKKSRLYGKRTHHF